MDMDAPIIQVACGLFVGGSDKLYLALLHPHKLAVYSVASSAAQLITVSAVYFHALQRIPYNMCIGPFGGCAMGRDYFCVQSIDGVLSFFEQDSFAFSRQLPNFLIPGVIVYSKQLEVILHGSSEMTLDAYRYSKLSSAADNTGDVGERADGGKKVAVDWFYNLGEHAVHVEIVKTRSVSGGDVHEICVVGENSLFTLKDSGKCRTIKRLIQDIAVARCFLTPDEGFNLLLVTRSGHLLVYKEMQLFWCARLQTAKIPVDIAVAEMCGIPGMVTVLDPAGNVDVLYMGTNPECGTLVNTEMKEPDYEQLEEEHQQLLATIRQHHVKGRSEPQEKLELEMVEYPRTFDRVEAGGDLNAVLAVEGYPLQLTLVFRLRATGNLSNLTISVRCSSCFITSLDSGDFIPHLYPSADTMLSVVFWMRPGIVFFLKREYLRVLPVAQRGTSFPRLSIPPSPVVRGASHTTDEEREFQNSLRYIGRYFLNESLCRPH